MVNLMNQIRAARDESVARHDDSVFAEGFATAAKICTLIVDEQAEVLNEQLRTGQLDNEGQQLLGRLQDIRKQIEERLDYRAGE